MRVQNVITVLGVAATTVAVTLTLAGSGRVEAIDQDVASETAIHPVIQQPTLEVAGVQVKLTMDKAGYEPGDEPTVLLEATNPTDRSVETDVWIGMTASSVASMLSRAPSMPQPFWTEKCELKLEPGATQKFRLQTGKQLAAGTSVSVTMHDKEQQAIMAKLLNVSQRRSPPLQASVSNAVRSALPAK